MLRSNVVLRRTNAGFSRPLLTWESVFQVIVTLYYGGDPITKHWPFPWLGTLDFAWSYAPCNLGKANFSLNLVGHGSRLCLMGYAGFHAGGRFALENVL